MELLNKDQVEYSAKEQTQRCWFSQLTRLLILLPLLMVLSTGCKEIEGGDADSPSSAGTPILDYNAARIAEDKARRRASDEVRDLDAHDDFAAKYGFQGLRNERFSENDFEVRIWVGYAPDVTRGLILSRDSAKYLPPIGETEDSKTRSTIEPKHVAGSEEIWPLLVRSGILEIPKEPESERVEARNDSDGIIVEIRKGKEYRYILYGAPCYSEGREAQSLISAITTIAQSLGIDFYECGNRP